MKNWKKVDILIAAAILLLIGVEIRMEARYSCEELVLKSENIGAILRESPEAEITEKDRKLFEELFSCDSAVELLGSGKDGYLSAAEDPDMKAVAETYLGQEKAGSLMVNVICQEKGETAKYLNWGETGNEIFGMQETGSGAKKEYYKICSFSNRPGKRIIYENWNNERAHKSVTQRRWFAWLRDRMWED